jgi:hypothetical protein
MTAKKPAGEKTPVLPTYEVKYFSSLSAPLMRGGVLTPFDTAHVCDHWVSKRADADKKPSF